MNQIEELERTLPGRLRRSAAAVTPDPDALGAVRARAAGRRRRSRTAVLIGSAAAVALVAIGVGVVSGGESSSGVVAGPASGPDRAPVSAPATTAPAAAPTTTAPVDADATLLIYRYPNATDEMIAEDPKMAGEWAELNTATYTCFANGPLEDLRDNSSCGESRAGELLELVDAGRPVAELGLGAPDFATHNLMTLLTTGLPTIEQFRAILVLLESLPDVNVSAADRDGSVTVSRRDRATVDTHTLTFDAATGHLLRRGWAAFPIGEIEYVGEVEYVAVTRVRAGEYIVPGREGPVGVTTTTTVPGDSEQPR